MHDKIRSISGSSRRFLRIRPCMPGGCSPVFKGYTRTPLHRPGEALRDRPRRLCRADRQSITPTSRGTAGTRVWEARQPRLRHCPGVIGSSQGLHGERLGERRFASLSFGCQRQAPGSLLQAKCVASKPGRWRSLWDGQNGSVLAHKADTTLACARGVFAMHADEHDKAPGNGKV